MIYMATIVTEKKKYLVEGEKVVAFSMEIEAESPQMAVKLFEEVPESAGFTTESVCEMGEDDEGVESWQVIGYDEGTREVIFDCDEYFMDSEGLMFLERNYTEEDRKELFG